MAFERRGGHVGELALGPLAGEPELFNARDLLRTGQELAGALRRGEGLRGLAVVLHQRTGFPVVIEDRDQSFSVSSPESASSALKTESSAPLSRENPGVSIIRSKAGWTVAACADGELFGYLTLLDKEGEASELDLQLLQHGATIVALEFLRQRSVAATEVTIWGDFLTELLENPDKARVRAHARRLGYDLETSYRAVLVCPATLPPELLLPSVQWAARWLGLRECMTTTRPNGVVLLVPHEVEWTTLPRLVANERDGGVRVGVGGRYGWEELGRSLVDAELALKLTASESPPPLVIFDELGVWRLLARTGAAELRTCVEETIGPLIEYDRQHHSELVKTLEAFLHSRGSHERVAASLYIHRSTLTYRLARVRNMTGADLSDPEQRLQLHLACRAWALLQALGE